MMKITSADFVTSNSQYQLCPEPSLPEYAFIGRSNVGKSSLINMLTSKKTLAKTSQVPGKTQLINHFLINKAWYLVDLPGYGYAKISKSEREKWEGMINDYLKFRPNLVCTFVLIDSRHEPVKNDLEFMEKLGMEGIPFHIIFTKTDKLKKSEVTSKINNYTKSLLEVWEEIPQYFISSAEKEVGRNEILDIIDQYNRVFLTAKN
jgi:GTP-binding protein